MAPSGETEAAQSLTGSQGREMGVLLQGATRTPAIANTGYLAPHSGHWITMKLAKAYYCQALF